MHYHVREYGAVGDGIHKDTEGLQSAIDTCSRRGGGRVMVPPGVFLSGSIYLKDHVDLHLMPGATIRGSPDFGDYNADDAFEQNRACEPEKATGGHLLIAHEARDVSISGSGTIDGHGPAFFERVPGQRKFSYRHGKRPGQMLYFCECRGVRVEGVALNDSPYWSCFLHGCEDVQVRGLRIRNPRETPCGDGIDIDCCRNVTVSDCLIDSGDDCITFRGNNSRLRNKERVCENVSVSNCVLRSATCAFRVGVGSGLIRHCAADHCVIHDSRTGIHFVSRWSTRGMARGADIDRVRFSNMTIDAYIPFWINSGPDAAGTLSNLTLHDMEVTAESGAFLSGLPSKPVRNVTFRNIDLEIRASDRKIRPPPYPDHMREGNIYPDRLPHAFYAQHIENLSWERVRITRDPALEAVGPAFVIK